MSFFLERSCTTESYGFLLYKELRRRLEVWKRHTLSTLSFFLHVVTTTRPILLGTRILKKLLIKFKALLDRSLLSFWSGHTLLSSLSFFSTMRSEGDLGHGSWLFLSTLFFPPFLCFCLVIVSNKRCSSCK